MTASVVPPSASHHRPSMYIRVPLTVAVAIGKLLKRSLGDRRPIPAPTITDRGHPDQIGAERWPVNGRGAGNLGLPAADAEAMMVAAGGERSRQAMSTTVRITYDQFDEMIRRGDFASTDDRY